MEPGLIGGEVNRILAAHAKKGKHPIQVRKEAVRCCSSRIAGTRAPWESSCHTLYPAELGAFLPATWPYCCTLVEDKNDAA